VYSVLIQKFALLQLFIVVRGQLSPDATVYFRGTAADVTHIGLAVTCTVVLQQQMPSRAEPFVQFMIRFVLLNATRIHVV
jgi:hypothetical protein